MMAQEDLSQTSLYKGFEIIPRCSSFELHPEAPLIEIASFVVRRGSEPYTVFAFTVKHIKRITEPQLSDEVLFGKAVKVIKDHIDNGQIKHLEEYTFEYDGMEFAPVNNPEWWKKNLANALGEGAVSTE